MFTHINTMKFSLLWCTQFEATFGGVQQCCGMQDAAAAGILALDGFSIKDMRKSRGLAACGGAVQGEAAAFPLHHPAGSSQELPHARHRALQSHNIWVIYRAVSFPVTTLTRGRAGARLCDAFSALLSCEQEPAQPQPLPQPPRLPRGGTSSGCRWLLSASGSSPSLPPAPPPSLPPSPLVFFFMDGMRWRSKNY